MRKGRTLSVDDLTLVIGTEKGQRYVWVQKPRRLPGLKREQLKILLLELDALNLCPDGAGTIKINRVNPRCRNRVDLVKIPLRNGLDDEATMAEIRRRLEACFGVLSVEAHRTSTPAGPKPAPIRVHAPARSPGRLSVPA